MKTETGFDKAVAAVGGRERFMETLGVSRRTFFTWKKGLVPLGRYLVIAERTGVPLHVLRPDVWPVPARRRRG